MPRTYYQTGGDGRIAASMSRVCIAHARQTERTHGYFRIVCFVCMLVAAFYFGI